MVLKKIIVVITQPKGSCQALPSQCRFAIEPSLIQRYFNIVGLINIATGKNTVRSARNPS